MEVATPLPTRIADIVVPQDDVSVATWEWARRTLPDYLLTHSVRAYCWGAAIAAREGWSFDRLILWTSSLMHDVGLTRITRNATCFEVEGGEIARRFLGRHGIAAETADVVARAIVLHMQPGVTMADGVEAVLLDRATSLDVRGAGYALVDTVRPEVMRAFPRRAFDRHFLSAIRREAAVRPTCQSARLLQTVGLADWMAGSPWASVTRSRPARTP
jgi:cyanamide hydratase family protein with HD domain